jgi:hypothetical protein
MTRSPSITPDLPSETVHMVLDDLGYLGRAWREIDAEGTAESDVVQNILGEQYSDVVQVIAFNVTEGWCRDVTEEVARAVVDLAREQGDTLGPMATRLYQRATRDDVPRDVASVA